MYRKAKGRGDLRKAVDELSALLDDCDKNGIKLRDSPKAERAMELALMLAHEGGGGRFHFGRYCRNCRWFSAGMLDKRGYCIRCR